MLTQFALSMLGDSVSKVRCAVFVYRSLLVTHFEGLSVKGG